MEISEDEKARIREKVEKLKNSRFKQQTLPAWRPIPSFRSTMITFTVFGVIFLGLGILLYLMSQQIQEFSYLKYDDADGCKVVPSNCTLKLVITEDVKAPIYVYYQLDNFYQNHRRYVKSRSFNQLRGVYISTPSELSDCDPIKYNRDLAPNITTSVSNKKLNGDDPAVPCGLVAKSFFNDTYTLIKPDGEPAKIVQTNIAWESDRQYKFKNTDLGNGTDWKDYQWLDMEDGKLFCY